MTLRSVCVPPEYCTEIDVVYNKSASYKDYVQALCARNSSLLTLHDFLADPKARSQRCQATALDFFEGTDAPRTRPIPDVDCLSNEFRNKATADHRDGKECTEDQPQGRILILEDLTVDIIEILGSGLDIDPLFLAMHLHTVHRRGMRHQTPDDATLPSRLYNSNFVNISYHQPVVCDDIFPAGDKFMMDAAIDRKLVFLRSTNIGLAQHRISVIKIQRGQPFWLGMLSVWLNMQALTRAALILVDPPLGDMWYRTEHKGDSDHKIRLKLRPYLGAYEDFSDLPKFSCNWGQTSNATKGGILDDLTQRWQRSVPDCFDPVDPTIQSLAYYPLRIVAAKWVKYIAVMHHCIKMYEYEGNRLDLEKFNMDLRELQGWRRRSMISQKKVKTVIRHLEAHESPHVRHHSAVDRVLEDFQVISTDIEDAGRRLENMLPVVTSLVQIIDARQSFAETANISRLTILALVFVPLSYVSSLFSMNSENMPGSKGFWVYFAVAIPVTFVVFLIARPPTTKGMCRTLSWLRNKLGGFPRHKATRIKNEEEKETNRAGWALSRT